MAYSLGNVFAEAKFWSLSIWISYWRICVQLDQNKKYWYDDVHVQGSLTVSDIDLTTCIMKNNCASFEEKKFCTYIYNSGF